MWVGVGVGINGEQGGGILFDMLKQNTKKLKCSELQMIGKTHQVHQ